MTDILSRIDARGITRLCHFTPSRNLLHIGSGNVGVLSTASLNATERSIFNPTDLERLDQHTTHICCSVEYPNAWYFDKARSKEKLFPDWVVLLIKPQYLAETTTLFSPRNAAANFGRNIQGGVTGFDAMYADRLQGAYGKWFNRSASHLPACPTDQQAEVLIYDRINIADISGVAVQSVEQADTEKVRLELNGVDPNVFRFVVAPHLFDKHELSAMIQSGNRLTETPV